MLQVRYSERKAICNEKKKAIYDGIKTVPAREGEEEKSYCIRLMCYLGGVNACFTDDSLPRCFLLYSTPVGVCNCASYFFHVLVPSVYIVI